MKKVCLSLLLAGGLSGVLQAQNQPEGKFTLNGDVSGLKTPVEYVYLSYAAKGNRVLDSVAPNGGKYSFTGELEEPTMVNLFTYKSELVNNRRQIASNVLFLEPGTIAVNHTDSFQNVKVKGSKANEAYQQLEALNKPLNDERQALIQQYYQEKDEAAKKELVDKINAFEPKLKENMKQFLESHPGSPVTVYLVNQLAGYDIDPEVVEPMLAKVPEKLQAYPSYKKLVERTEIAKKTAIGQYALNFIQNDTLGKPVSLESMKGKYLLIDFWASWCGPCRVENPNVVKAFNKYKDKGFFIMGISLDRKGDKDKWIKAIHDDNLTWTHVSDLQFWDNAVAQQYGIRAIPQNLLLDPEGRIIAKNLRGEALDKKLDELFN